MESSASRWRWQPAVEWIAAVAMAAVWLVAGLWKLSDLTATQVRMTQALVPKPLSFAAALSFGTAETFAAILLLAPRWRRWGSWLSVLLLSAFMAYIGIHYRELTGAECACFPWLKRAIGPMFFVQDAALIVLAIVAGWWARPPHGSRSAAVALAAVLALAGGMFAMDRARGNGVVSPPSIIVEGHEFSLLEGRVFLYFFNPYCPHCFKAAQGMAQFHWQAAVIGVPTQAFEEGQAFFQSAGWQGVRLSPDIVRLRQSLPFQDVPYAAALENGRVRQKFVFFEEPELGEKLRQMGFTR